MRVNFQDSSSFGSIESKPQLQRDAVKKTNVPTTQLFSGHREQQKEQKWAGCWEGIEEN